MTLRLFMAAISRSLATLLIVLDSGTHRPSWAASEAQVSSVQTSSLQVITHYLTVLLTVNLSCLSNCLTYRIAQTNK